MASPELSAGNRRTFLEDHQLKKDIGRLSPEGGLAVTSAVVTLGRV
jgi:hypothetical protein